MDNLAFSDACTLAGKIQSGDISSVELLDHFVNRVEKYNPEINAIVCDQISKARVRAKEADDALARGESWGPLHGVPMTVKESYNIAGLPTTFGIPEMKNNIATEDAVACQRLQGAGAIIFAKTNVPLYLADFQSFNDIYGKTGNPHNLDLSPGGSSGGSAAAMAAGLSGLEMGSDIGGSIRNPAHYCGVFGHKPTWGVLPMRGHALPGILTPSDISVIGPLARSAEDLALVMGIVAGADDLHHPGWDLNLPQDDDRPLKDYRVAAWVDDQLAPVDNQVKERVLKVAQLVEAEGGKVDYEARPDFAPSHSHDVYTDLLHSAMSARQPEEVFEQNLERRKQLAADDKSDLARVTRGSTLHYREWHQRNEERTHLRWAWHEFFKRYDILLTPACVAPAFPHDHNPQVSERSMLVNNEPRSYFEQVFWAGLTGVSYLPSTVVPTGPNDSGLPIGVQIVTGEMRDLTSIAFARKVHERIGGFVPAPNYAD